MGDGDAPDLRVTEAEEEGPVRLVEEKAGDELLADEANNQPGRAEGEDGLVELGVQREWQWEQLLGPQGWGTHPSDQ